MLKLIEPPTVETVCPSCKVVDCVMLGNDQASRKNVDTGVSFDRQIVLPINPYKMRVWCSTAASISTGSAYVLVPHDTVIFDTASGFNVSNHNFKIPLSGYYQVNGSAQTLWPSVSGSIYTTYLTIFVNGSAGSIGNTSLFTQASTPVTQTLSANVSDVIFLNQNDLVDLRITCAYSLAGGANPTIANQSWLTYWSMHLISV
jgi:hypothetical protein